MTLGTDAPLAIEDYALVGDCISAALVGRNGSIDWLCWPRFDSPACFAALLGTPRNGRCLIGPKDADYRVSRRYRDDTMILETRFDTADGAVELIDFMAVGQPNPSLVRIVRGLRGHVPLHLHMTLRFDYGASVPWVTQLADQSGICAIAGPNLVVLRTSVDLQGRDMATVADFGVGEGEEIAFVFTYSASHLAVPPAFPVDEALHRTEAYWRDWSAACKFEGPFREATLRSFLTLKALTFAPTGGIVAAPTTSLPEALGDGRNWDYRYCWLRDATLTLHALMSGGYYEEAHAWRDWLQRSIAGTPADIQIMYGIAGERLLAEWKVPWLPGYQGNAPVRVGNGAATQFQMDVFGEVAGALHQARRGGISTPAAAWALQCQLVDHLCTVWEQPDEGIWEIRGQRLHFTHSKAMAWLALDCSIADAEAFKLEAPLAEWKRMRAQIHACICARGFDASRNSFTQSFGSPELDASLLTLPLIGFLPADDPRIVGTVAAVERELLVDGFVRRYRTESGVDGLPPGEGVFLACSFWLADVYVLQGRCEEAEALFRRLLALRNDVGLLAEEYDPVGRRQLGNFPQAFSHVALINCARFLAGDGRHVMADAAQ